jgi:hypothetical protein
LSLNITKPKEVVIDYRRNKSEILPLEIRGEKVEVVPCYKYLGTQITNDLSWETQITLNLKKGEKRLYFLRILKTFHVNKDILATFYRATVESCLVYGLLVWFAAANKKDTDRLQKVIKMASCIIGAKMMSLEEIYKKRASQIRWTENCPVFCNQTSAPSAKNIHIHVFSMLITSDRT